MHGPGPILFLFAAMAAFVAFDAFRTGAMRRLLVSLVSTVALSAAGLWALQALPGQTDLQPTNKLQREFGPDWDCSSGAFCIRKTPKP